MNGLLDLSWIVKNLHYFLTNRQIFVQLPSYGIGSIARCLPTNMSRLLIDLEDEIFYFDNILIPIILGIFMCVVLKIHCPICTYSRGSFRPSIQSGFFS